MGVSFKGVDHQLTEGTNVFYEYVLDPGANWLTFTGTGRVAIDFKGVSL